MSDYQFLFDLDATITKKEILPAIAAEIGFERQMKEMTERTMQGEIPFEESFLQRVEILKAVPVSEVRKLVADIPVHEDLAEFIRENADRCWCVTGNLNIWIRDLMEKLGLEDHYLCSYATEENDRIIRIDSVQDKGKLMKRFADQKFVAVGDGNNDAEMLQAADIGIAFGGVRNIAPALLRVATHATYSEEKLCQFLRQLL